MTLTEYLNQKDPVRHPRVMLTKRQIKFGASYKLSRGEVRTSCWINTSDPRVAGIEYCIVNGILYTTDSDGNPKNSSVFRYYEKSESLPERLKKAGFTVKIN